METEAKIQPEIFNVEKFIDFGVEKLAQETKKYARKIADGSTTPEEVRDVIALKVFGFLETVKDNTTKENSDTTIQ